MRRKASIEAKIRKRKRAQNKSRPASLPSTRPRALTPPLHEDTTASLQQRLVSWIAFGQSLEPKQGKRYTSNQTQSRLLTRLPVELRIQIWSHVLGGRLLHMACLHRKLCAVACPLTCSLETGLEVDEAGCWMLAPAHAPYAPAAYMHEKSELPHRAKAVHLISLLQTCRLLYSEAVHVLYSENTFDFTYADSLVYFAESILPDRLARVRRINITWTDLLNYHSKDVPWDMDAWLQMCAVLQRCTGLVQLTLQLGLLRRATDEQTRVVLDTLARCRVSGQFDLILQWPQTRCQSFAAEHAYPFRLMSILDYDVARLNYNERAIAYINHPHHWRAAARS